MPIDYKKYPKNWKTEIRPMILTRAKNCCEECKVANYAIISRTIYDGIPIRKDLWNGPVYNDVTGEEFTKCSWHLSDWASDHTCKIILTIAHLDHDITNSEPENLKALCQRCHLRYDKDRHQANSKETREKKKGNLKLDFKETIAEETNRKGMNKDNFERTQHEYHGTIKN